MVASWNPIFFQNHRFHILHFPNSTGFFTKPTGRHYTKYRFSPDTALLDRMQNIVHFLTVWVNKSIICFFLRFCADEQLLLQKRAYTGCSGPLPYFVERWCPIRYTLWLNSKIPDMYVWTGVVWWVIWFEAHFTHEPRAVTMRAQKKVSKGRRPKTPLKSCSVVTDPQV